MKDGPEVNQDGRGGREERSEEMGRVIRVVSTGDIWDPAEMYFQPFRKKPVAIEAYKTAVPLDIETLEGTMRANAGDWIIRGVKGELYPCKPDIFEATYEPV